MQLAPMEETPGALVKRDNTAVVDALVDLRLGTMTQERFAAESSPQLFAEVNAFFEDLEWHLQDPTGTKSFDKGDWSVLREALRHVGGRYKGDRQSDQEKRCALYLSCEGRVKGSEILQRFGVDKGTLLRMRHVLFCALFGHDDPYDWGRVVDKYNNNQRFVYATVADTKAVYFKKKGAQLKNANGTDSQLRRVELPALDLRGQASPLSSFATLRRPVGLVTFTTTTTVAGVVTQCGQEYLMTEDPGDLDFLGNTSRIIGADDYKAVLDKQARHKKVSWYQSHPQLTCLVHPPCTDLCAGLQSHPHLTCLVHPPLHR
jgi:hypothetical protein